MTRTCPDCQNGFQAEHQYQTRCYGCWMKIKTDARRIGELQEENRTLSDRLQQRITSLEETLNMIWDYVQQLNQQE